MARQSMYIRLKPHNPRRGHVLRRFCFKGKVFHVGRWYKVSEAFAQQVSELHQKHYDEDSPYAFDVATEAQARAIEAKERAKEEAERKKVDRAEVVAAQEVRDDSLRSGAGALTTAALPHAEEVDDPKPAKAVAKEDRELGVSMANTKDELVDVAESLGINPAGKTKREILDAIEGELADSEDE